MFNRIALAALLAFLLGTVAADAQLGCWGSICQDSTGRVYLSSSMNAKNAISISMVPGAGTIPGDLVLPCTRTQGLPPGFNAVALRARPGTKAGTTKLVVQVGTSLNEVTVVDNLAGGGC